MLTLQLGRHAVLDCSLMLLLVRLKRTHIFLVDCQGHQSLLYISKPGRVNRLTLGNFSIYLFSEHLFLEMKFPTIVLRRLYVVE
jgi:hypothetical protein